MTGKKTTMKDVAKLAGVTQPTVSYVLNGTASISEEVKERVWKAVKELNYRPNYNAVALKRQKSNVIGVVIPDITNTFYSNIVSLLEKELTKMGYLVLISSTGYKAHVEVEILNRFLDHNAEAFFIAYELGNKECWRLLADSGKQVVTFEAGSAAAEFSGIETDNYHGAFTAVKHLIDEGRRHIVYIGQPGRIEALEGRKEGYIDAIRKYGSGQEPEIFRAEASENKHESGIRIGRILAERKDIDGIFVSSDEIAVGIIKTLISSGIRVPGHVSVIGYDNIPLAGLYIPELTTVSQPFKEICATAAMQLQKLLAGEEAQSVTLKPELILRGTTLPLK